MKKTTTAVLILIAWAAAAQVKDAAGIVYGKDHAFALLAPKGWILDNRSGRAQGLHAVFYRDGETWQRAATVMYANAASKRTEGQGTLEELMKYDVEQFRKRAPRLRADPLPDIVTEGGSTARVLRFEGDEHGNHEAVAYLDEEHTIVLLVLSSRKQDAFDAAYADFEKLVRSYRFLTSSVVLP